jgi:hypothetical protein
MAGHMDGEGFRRGNGAVWRIPLWGVLGALLATPLIAMQFTDQVKWGPEDFAVIGTMLAAVGGAVEVAARMSGNIAYRFAVGVGAVTAFVLVWMNLAVGIIGGEDNPLNLMFGGVLVVGLIGTLVSRFRPRGMALTLVAAALAQIAVAAVAQVYGHFIWVLTGAYAAAWILSAGLFWKAAEEGATA